MENLGEKLYDIRIPMSPSPSKVVLATDSPQIASIIRAKLERDGLEVFWRPDGKAAIEFVQSNPPDLMIIDSILPDLSGLDLLERIRSLPGLESLPVFVLLDVLQEHSAEEFLRRQAQEVLPKPFRPTDLSKKIRKILSSRPVPASK